MTRLLLLLSILAILAVFYLSPRSAASSASPIDVVVYTQKGEVMLDLEPATTPREREIGLMNRDTVKPHDGIIFVFPDIGVHKFWMKNTRIPLDMIFIDGEQTITAIAADVPPQTLDLRGPNTPSLAVIELDGGRASADGIAVGDKVRYALPEGIKVE